VFEEGETLSRIAGYAAYIFMTQPELGKKLMDELSSIDQDADQ
jgi:hypothetical protein